MKVQLYLFLLLSLIFSTNLSAVRTTGTIDKTKTEKIVKVKKKPVKRFFQNMTQRVLENKIVKRLERKFAKEKRGSRFLFGLLSLIFVSVGLTILFVAGSLELFPFVVLGAGIGGIGLILGSIGVFKDDNKVMSTIGIALGILPFVIFIGLIISIF